MDNQERKLKEFAKAARMFAVCADALVNAAYQLQRHDAGGTPHRKAHERYELRSKKYDEASAAMQAHITAYLG